MKGKRFALVPGQALVTMEGTLVQYYSLRQSLRAIPEEDGRVAVQRIASLIESNFVIAAQMALGVSAMQGRVPPGLLEPIDRYVSNITEPYHDDAELTSIKSKVTAGRKTVEAVSVGARPFARWAVLAYAWDDKVAIDAALGGFCMSSPTGTDVQTLVKAVTAARLDRSQVFPDSAALSGGLPVGERSHRH
ncbi:hypothetical protein ACSFA0_23695 [Variovorax sp. LT1P1]|uniref:hypothetical protein n=1 Tax=Variovorax sp. LT1P1 TaxID=3443730 RepID=UPI003F48414A